MMDARWKVGKDGVVTPGFWFRTGWMVLPWTVVEEKSQNLGVK